jgi:spore coat polysaccharide biosynthesis protein SpsF
MTLPIPLVHAVVHARMSSKRLPGKVMRKVYGIPLLGHLIDRLGRCKELDGVMIATTSDPVDEAISKFAAERGVPCFRGDRNDVAGRLIEGASQFGIQHMVRISGDSPMLDPAIVSQALRIYRSELPDLVTNVQERTFPRGQSVEIFTIETLSKAWNSGMSDFDKEHVTTCFYSYPEKYSILNIRYPGLRGDVQLSVDTEQDFLLFERIVGQLGAPYWRHGLVDILKAYDSLMGTFNEAS